MIFLSLCRWRHGKIRMEIGTRLVYTYSVSWIYLIWISKFVYGGRIAFFFWGSLALVPQYLAKDSSFYSPYITPCYLVCQIFCSHMSMFMVSYASMHLMTFLLMLDLPLSWGLPKYAEPVRRARHKWSAAMERAFYDICYAQQARRVQQIWFSWITCSIQWLAVSRCLYKSSRKTCFTGLVLFWTIRPVLIWIWGQLAILNSICINVKWTLHILQ